MQPLESDVQLITPRDPARRGCQLSLRIQGPPGRGRRVFEALHARGAICDWRTPDIIRAAPVPLYNRFEDAWSFAQILAEALRA